MLCHGHGCFWHRVYLVTLSLGEFNLTWMLHTPLTQTLPVGLADAFASMRIEVGSAYTLVFFLILVLLLVLMQALGVNTVDKACRSFR